MARQIVTTRLTEAQVAVLKNYAEQNGITFYRAVSHAVERGLAAMLGGAELAGSGVSWPEQLEDGLAMLQAHADRNERLAKQGLYAVGATYAAIIAVAKSSLPPDQAQAFDERITAEADRIFQRQLAKALED
jgi:hypothetical protein